MRTDSREQTLRRKLSDVPTLRKVVVDLELPSFGVIVDMLLLFVYSLCGSG